MRDDQYRLRRISELGAQLSRVIAERDITREDLLNDLETQWLITTPLFNIGEQTNQLSRQLVEQHPEIPWAEISGLRHRLAHDYEGTNWTMIAEVVFDELSAFIKQVEELDEFAG
ncbi:MAG TPA: DUF86 domain-containing protein [Coriobacteriaceae bacterium]|nr:DUF86 domain-containing protein [Coriobacteriaceae bacterium]